MKCMLPLFAVCGVASLLSLGVSAEAGSEAPRIGKIYWVGSNHLSRANADGTDVERLVSGLKGPDGVGLDLHGNRVYWTNMGRGPTGSVQRARLDGTPIDGDGEFLIEPGGITTGKEIELDLAGGKMYFADRDAARIVRANLDGSGLETLVTEFRDSHGEKRALKNTVGMALDLARGTMYFTDRYTGIVYRAGMEIPEGETHATRTDVEIVVEGVAMTDRPIDIDLDLAGGKMYWVDRGTRRVLRANLDGTGLETLIDETKVDIRVPIGLSLDIPGGKIIWSDVAARTIYRANMDGSEIETVVSGEEFRPLGVEYKALEPESGSASGGERVAILGANFVPGKTEVRFGEKAATEVEVVAPELLIATSPSGAVGAVDISVATPEGVAVRRNGFAYTAD